MGGFVSGKGFVPLRFTGFACGLGVPVGIDRFGDLEGLGRPAQGFAGEFDFFGAQGFAVGLGGACTVGRALADGGLADDQGGFVGAVLGSSDGFGDSRSVVAIYGIDHIPATGGKALGGVVDEPRGDLTVDRDAVVVVQGNQLVQLPGAGQGHGLVADAFHQAAVTQEHVGVVIDNFVVIFVELSRQHFLGQGHAHGVGDALAQWAGGGFHAGGDAHFGVTRSLAVELTEVLQFFDRQLVAGQVQHRIDQHRAMAVGQHKAVAVGPMRVAGVVLQVIAPQRHGHVGHAHGCAGVPRIGLLNSVHRKGADGVGHLLLVCHVGSSGDGVLENP